MLALTPTYSSPTTTDPFPGLTKLSDALSEAASSLLLGFLLLAVAGICVAIWRSIQPEVPGMAVLSVIIAATGFFGLKSIADAYNTMDAATGGFIGKLFSAAFALAPVLVFGLIWLVGRWLDR